MCILEDSPIPITAIVGEEEVQFYYKVRSVHRRQGNPNKCIWTISLKEEVDCFKYSVTENWLENTKGWGLKFNAEEGSLEQVGLSEQNESLKIAKFIDSGATSEWHGYPADYCRRLQDKPSTKLLNIWKNSGIISKGQMIKITKGQRCNL